MSQSADRPLSPHLQVYQPQLTSVLSIMHRFAGLCLSIGAIVLAVWLVSAAMGPDAFAAVNGQMGTWYGHILLFLWTLALFYHLCNGIRHLLWDTGSGLDLNTTYVTGYIAVAAAIVLTVVAWVVAFV